MKDSNNNTELDALVDAYLDGRWSDQEADRLSALIEKSAEARDRYWELALVHGLLEQGLQTASVKAATGEAPTAMSVKRGGFFQYTTDVDPSGDVFDEPFKDVNGLKALLKSDHKKVAYNVARKFFEYTNGYQPTLAQRLDLFAMIPDNAEECGMRDLLVDVMMYSVDGER